MNSAGDKTMTSRIKLTDGTNSVTFTTVSPGRSEMRNSLGEHLTMPIDSARGRVAKLLSAGWRLV